jgi:WD repeat-containing protein 23
MTNTLDSSPEQVALNFNDPRPGPSYEDRFAIWSCRFSADGNEVIAGGNAMIYGPVTQCQPWHTADHRPVYDLLANRRTVKIVAHDDDVNSCCWADTASGNVLVSASDDTFLKVWFVLRTFGRSRSSSPSL